VVQLGWIFVMPEPNTSRRDLVAAIRRFAGRRVFIVSVFAAVVTVNLWIGEPALMRGLAPVPVGGPPIEESGSLSAQTVEPPPYDTLSASSQSAGSPDFGDPLIRFGDTIGGAADPSGALLEWVPETAKIITHTVAEGETVSDIAKSYGVSAETILWANALSASSVIKPGDELKFPSISGVLHTVRAGQTLSGIAASYGVSVERILAANRGISAASLEAGEELIIPGGRPAASRSAASSGGSPAPLAPAGYFKPPTIGLNWGRLHPMNAVDIANSCGTPVWAAAGGVVEWAGWDPGWYYGNYIVIRHPNGMRTYYAHLRTGSLLVSAGTPVSQGEKIAEIGNTGRTIGVTGCHLHFEVRGGVNPFARYR
jgi:murein DD-endopeptidase MepM/ murein hydrolase activator NlpD